MDSSEKLKKTSKPPKFIVGFFLLILAIASFNLVSDITSLNGFKPFGFIEEIVAQVVRPAPNRGDIVRALRGGEPIEDSFDRCEVIDPNLDGANRRKKVSDAGLGSASILGDNMGGANMAVWLNQNDRELNRRTAEYAANLGMSYNLAMVTRGDGAAVQDAATFIEESTEAGLMPIIRLCYAGNCEFNTSASIISFYERLAQVSNYEFIAILGPNEPGTGGSPENPSMYEGAGFISGFNGAPGQYDQLVNQTNEIARAFQDQRGVKMYLAPAIFNLTNTQNNDVKNYLYEGETIDPDLFDYLMGNIYAELDVPNSYDVYQNGAEKPYGLGTYADEKGMDVIITEFGIFHYDTPSGTPMAEVVNKPERAELIEKAKNTFAEFCEDDNVLGVLFFRSFMYDNLEKIHSSVDSKHAMSPGEHAEIIGDCKKAGGFRDFAWANCNFDSCTYNDTSYSANSTANACGTEYDSPGKYTKENGAAVEIGCSSGGGCSASAMSTIQVRAPIKSFGTNTSGGTKSKPYISVCAELAAIIDGSNYDALNQFAGKMTSGSIANYPMPWLGSAINCAAQLSLMRGDSTSDITAATRFSPSIGSRIDQTLEEVTSAWENKFRIDGPQNQFKNLRDDLIDERTLCRVDKESGKKECLDKVNINALADWHVYNPYIIPGNTEPTTCGEDTRFFNDKSNYIIGPEVVVESNIGVYSGTTSEVCQFIANRKNGQPSDVMLGMDHKGKNSTRPDCTIPSITVNVPGRGSVFCPTFMRNEYNCTNENILAGTCAFYPEHSNLFSCLDYDYKSTDDVFIKTDKWADNPDFEVPGAYDALYQMYMRVQNNLETRDRKIVFRENIAWKFEVDSILRDTGREANAGGDGYENWYQQSLSSCEVPSNLYTGQNYLAKNNPIRREYQYYEWLGYLDILQEIAVAYLDDDSISAESWVKNPAFGNSSVPSLQDRPEILVSGTTDPSSPDKVILGSSNLLLSYPVYTCDELEGFYNENSNITNKSTCITNKGDERFDDELGLFLCNKGYTVPWIPGCEGLCKEAQKQEEIGDLELKNPSCPLEPSVICTQGPLGNASHACANEDVYAFDLANSEQKIVAPEDGKIIKAVGWDEVTPNQENACFGDSTLNEIIRRNTCTASWCNYPNDPSSVIRVINENGGIGSMKVISTGANLTYQGDSGITYRLVHLDMSEAEASRMVGMEFTGGEKITTNSGREVGLYKKPFKLSIPCWSGPHLHFESSAFGSRDTEGDIDPYFFVGDILRCGDPVRVCRNDRECEAPPWITDLGLESKSEVECKVDPNSKEASKDYDNIFMLAEKIEESYGVPGLKYLLMSTMSTEARSDFERSIGPGNIEDGTATENAVYSGDPYDTGYENENDDRVMGPMQIMCSTFLAYGYPPGAANDLGCADPTAGIGSRYGPVIQCVEDLGMNEGNGDKLDRKYVGHSLCVAAYMLILNMGSGSHDLLNFPVSNNEFDRDNPIYNTAHNYFCGGAFCPAGPAYANQTLGRFMVLRANWEQFISGEHDFEFLRNYRDNLGLPAAPPQNNDGGGGTGPQ